MNNTVLISIELKSKFGFFKKTDTNDPIYFTYNIMPKTYIIGFLGAVIGLKGYQDNKTTPEFWDKLKDIKTGICPLNSNKGNYRKVIIDYTNTVGYANKDGGTLMIREQTLINPSYKVFLLLDKEIPDQNNIYENLKNYSAVFVPYMGKNDFQIWWENFTEYDTQNIPVAEEDINIETLFLKDLILKDNISRDFSKKDLFAYFEKLPVGFNEQTGTYIYSDFAYTNFKISKNAEVKNLYKLNNSVYITLN